MRGVFILFVSLFACRFHCGVYIIAFEFVARALWRARLPTKIISRGASRSLAPAVCSARERERAQGNCEQAHSAQM